MKRNEIPDEKYKDADTDPGVAYELGRKDGWNTAIDEVVSGGIKAVGELIEEEIKKANEARTKEMYRQLWGEGYKSNASMLRQGLRRDNSPNLI